MKKTIATISLAMVMGFGMALAHADDSMSNTTSNTSAATGDTGTAQQPGQQPGTVGGTNDSATAPSDQMAAPDTSKSTDTYTESHKSAKAKTCTDDTGKVLHKGQTGFKDCMKNMKDQMGGTVDQSKTEVHKHMDSANPSDSAPAQGTGSDNMSH